MELLFYVFSILSPLNVKYFFLLVKLKLKN